MVHGIIASICWAIETVIIGVVLQKNIFVETEKAILLAPFISTFFHDMFSAVIMYIFNFSKKEVKKTIACIKTRNGKFLIFASLIGGPIGMCGYFLAINYLGPSIGALSSAIFPAIGAVLAYIFLKEDMPWYRWIFLICTLSGVFLLSYSPELNVTNFWLGIAGALMCSFGWGTEGVILSKCFKGQVKEESCLMIRQTVSFVTLGCIVLPLTGGYEFIAQIKDPTIFLLIALAACFATFSELNYFKAIGKIGVSKAMALNITYTAFAPLFSIIFLKDYSLLNPFTITLVIVIITSSFLGALDFKKLENKHKLIHSKMHS